MLSLIFSLKRKDVASNFFSGGAILLISFPPRRMALFLTFFSRRRYVTTNFSLQEKGCYLRIFSEEKVGHY